MDVSSPSHHGRHLVLGNTTGYTIFVRDLAQHSISHLAALAATRPLQPAVGRIPCLPGVAATGAASGIVSWLPPTTRNDLDPARQKGPMNRTARSASPNITFATLDVGGRHPPAATTEPVTRVGLIGLGVIGAVHLDVLRGFPNVVVVFVVDPRTPPEVRHRTVPRAPTLRAALELAQAPDLLVVATPTDTHLDLVADGLDQTRALVLSEKPLTRSATQLREFEANHAADLLRLRVVNHFAFSPEIEWAVRLVKAMGWGPPQQVIADFNDPYVTKTSRQRTSYVSPWVDSGSNQISMLARLCRAWTIKGQHVDSHGLRSVTELAFAGGRATLLANWSTGDSSKQTSLRWSTGREIFLDHTAMTGYAMVDGAVTDHAGHNGVIGRKAAHYTAMYRALFAGTDEDLLSLELAHSVSALLEAGARAATAAQPRANSTGTR